MTDQLNGFFQVLSHPTNVPILIVVIRILIAALLGFLISFVSMLTYSGESYEHSIIHSQVILTTVSAIVILIIGNNLARAFGLLGALSIVRFRTTLKDTKDTAIVFFSIAIGMACGAGSISLAWIGFAIISLILLTLKKLPFYHPRHTFIKFTYTDTKTAVSLIENALKTQNIHYEFSAMGLKTNTISYKIRRNKRHALDFAMQLQSENPEIILSLGIEPAD